MTQVYGKELAERIREDLNRTYEIIDDRNRRISDWQTDEDDCFFSIRMDEQSIEQCKMKLSILESDGTRPFTVVVDENGKIVKTHWFKNNWGGESIVGNGVFASSMRALLKKTGWHQEERNYPVWVKFVANGSGMFGAYTGSYQVVRWHTNMVTGEYVGFDN